jgi:hypothetical protein
VTVRDISTGTTAADLGSFPPAGADGRHRGGGPPTALTTTTKIADLFGGAGVDQRPDGLVIYQRRQSVTIDLSDGGDGAGRAQHDQQRGPHVRAEINAAATASTSINTVSGHHDDRSARTAGGGDALGIRSLHGGSTLERTEQRSRRPHGRPARPICASPPRTAARSTSNLDGAATINDVLDRDQRCRDGGRGRGDRATRGHGQRHPPESTRPAVAGSLSVIRG